MSVCPKCRYVGDPWNCSCAWTLRKVVEGKGGDSDVIQNARTILAHDPRQKCPRCGSAIGGPSCICWEPE